MHYLPNAFSIYSEHIMREAFDEWQGEVTIGGHKMEAIKPSLRYVDVTVLLVTSKEELLHIMSRLEVISERYGLKLNMDKTKVMIVR